MVESEKKEDLYTIKLLVQLVIVAITIIVLGCCLCWQITKSIPEYNFVTVYRFILFDGKINFPLYSFKLKEVFHLVLFSKKVWTTFLAMPVEILFPVFIACIVYISLNRLFYRVFRALVNRKSTLYGSSRWAKKEELEEMKLLTGKGLVMGQTKEAYLEEVVDKKAPKQKKDESDAEFEVRRDRFTGKKWEVSEEGDIISHMENAHTLVVGSTRSGKGVSVIIPTLFKWMESVIVMDPKSENWQVTSNFRSKFSYTFKFEPEKPKESIHYNPLLAIRRGKNTKGDTDNLCQIIMPDVSGSNADPFWQNEGRRLLAAVIIYVIYCEPPEKKNFKSVYSALSKKIVEPVVAEEEKIDEYVEKMQMNNATSLLCPDIGENGEDNPQQQENKEELSALRKRLKYMVDQVTNLLEVARENQVTSEELIKEFEERHKLHGKELVEVENKFTGKYFASDIENLEMVEEDLRYFFESEERTLNNVKSTMTSTLGVMADPNLQEITDRSDFTAEDFVYGVCDEHGQTHPVSLYLCVTLSSMKRLLPMLKIFYEQTISLLTSDLDVNKKRPYHLQMIFDEFYQMGKLDIVENTLAMSAGYGVLCTIVIQSFDQLKKLYQSEDNITNNCAYTVVLRVSTDETAKKIQEMLGKETVSQTKIDTSGSSFEMVQHQESWHTSESGKYLMTSDEIRTMPYYNSLIIYNNQSEHRSFPYKAKKIFYFADDRFRKLYLDKKGKVLPAPAVEDNYPHPEAVKLDESGNPIVEKIVMPKKVVKGKEISVTKDRKVMIGVDYSGWHFLLGTDNSRKIRMVEEGENKGHTLIRDSIVEDEDEIIESDAFIDTDVTQISK